MTPIRFTNLTRNLEIGANCYLLEMAGRRVLLDCGAHPKHDGPDAEPLWAPLHEAPPLDAVLLSHAHQDHLGSLPVLMRKQTTAPVFMTDPTLQLADVMLHNSVNVMSKRHENEGAPPPSFSHKEASACVRRFQALPYQQRFNLAGERLGFGEGADVTLQLENAGHILGSAAFLLESQGRRLLYTGDINFQSQSLMVGATLPEQDLDTVIIESTRGSTEDPAGLTRASEEERFAAAIREVFAKGGSVLVPIFALGKSQEFLAMTHSLRKRGLLPECPVHIGGLSTKLTEIHDALRHAPFRQHPGMNLLETLAPFTVGGREIHNFPVRPGNIYALSSGMMSEHTLSNLIAPHFLPNTAHGIFFVGYADPLSPGGRLKTARLGEAFQPSPDVPPETLRCKVDSFNFSSHARREDIVSFLKKAAPKHVLFVHGDPEAIAWFHQKLAAELPDTRLLNAAPGQTVEF